MNKYINENKIWDTTFVYKEVSFSVADIISPNESTKSIFSVII